MKVPYTRQRPRQDQAVLDLLRSRPGEWVSADEIADALLPEPRSDALARVHVYRLRQRGVPVETWPGHGYRMAPSASQEARGGAEQGEAVGKDGETR